MKWPFTFPSLLIPAWKDIHGKKLHFFGFEYIIFEAKADIIVLKEAGF